MRAVCFTFEYQASIRIEDGKTAQLLKRHAILYSVWWRILQEYNTKL
jgi:hypothetical protein